MNSERYSEVLNNLLVPELQNFAYSKNMVPATLSIIKLNFHEKQLTISLITKKKICEIYKK